MNSPRGLFLKAIREDEDAALVMGIDTVRWKLIAFTVSSSFAGLAGGLYGHYIGIVSPEMMLLTEMGVVVAMAAIGGVGSLIGPAIGASFVELLSEQLRTYAEWRFVIFGLLLVVIMRFYRNGLYGMLEALSRRLRLTHSKE